MLQSIGRYILLIIISVGYWSLIFIIIVLLFEFVSELLFNRAYGLLTILENTIKNLVEDVKWRQKD